MGSLNDNKIVDKRDMEPPTVATIGDVIKYKQEIEDREK